MGNAEKSKENRKQFRCDLRLLNKEIEWRLPNSLFTRTDVEKKSVIWTSEAWEINWNRFPITEGMVQLPRGSARARKVAKQQIDVTFNSRARDEVIFSHKSRFFFLFFSPRSFQFSIFSFFSISSILKKTSVARLRGPHPFTFGKPSAGHQKRARGPILDWRDGAKQDLSQNR